MNSGPSRTIPFADLLHPFVTEASSKLSAMVPKALALLSSRAQRAIERSLLRTLAHASSSLWAGLGTRVFIVSF